MALKIAAILCTFIFHISIILALPIQKYNLEWYKSKFYRLDGSVIPSLYNIQIIPYILKYEVRTKERFTFDGRVEITLHATIENVTEIILHVKSLDIEEEQTELFEKNQTDQTIQIMRHNLVMRNDKLTLELNKELKINTDYVLILEYSGKISDDNLGFYKSSYRDKNGEKIWLATTQFQVDHARKVFPCFDEPKYKAQFEIEICRHEELNSVSNMPLKEQLRDTIDCPNRVKDIYKRSPKMSTYLVAFIVSNFKARKDSGNGNFSVFAQPGAYNETFFSFEIGKSLLKAFDDYLGIPYQQLGNEKMDMAAIPDFIAGAMENWGLTTYKDDLLLYHYDKTTDDIMQKIATIISHELAHQWFGNYVTCDWWSYTWLNEAFATFFESFMLGKVKPEWEMEKQFPLNKLHDVFIFDSKIGTHPMTDESVITSLEADKMFSKISYEKGGAVIRMVQHLLGEMEFRNALRSYIEANKEKTSTPEKLFTEFKKVWKNPATLADFEQFLKDFTEQVGYPLVTVELSGDGTKLRITQKRFLLSNSDGSDDTLLYTIPFSFTTNKYLDFETTNFSIFINKTTVESEIKLPEEVDFVICNIQQIGYYRVNYDENSWQKISKFLNSKNYKKIHENNRGQIIDDLFNMANAGSLSYRFALNIINYIKREEEYVPWSAAFNGFSFIAKFVGHEKVFAAHILNLTDNVYERLGFKEEPVEKKLDKYNRIQVIDWACKYGNKRCISEAKRLFKIFLDNHNKQVPVNLRHPVYCTGIREGDEKDFDLLWKMYLNLNEHATRDMILILKCLGCTKHKGVVEKYLNHILSSNVPPHYKPIALYSLCTENSGNVQIVLDYIMKNYRKVARSFRSLSYVSRTFSLLARRFTNNDQVRQIQKFYKENSDEFKPFKGRFKEAEKVAKENLKWIGSHSTEILNFFEETSNIVAIKSINVFTLILCFAIAIF